MEDLDKYKKLALEKLKEKKRQEDKRWENLTPFKNAHDVPKLPIPMTPFHIEKLIEAGAIPKTELVDGKMYYGECRNADHAIWDAKRDVFVYKRNKFGYVFDEDINHFEDDDGYDLFVPIKLEDEINIKKPEN